MKSSNSDTARRCGARGAGCMSRSSVSCFISRFILCLGFCGLIQLPLLSPPASANDLTLWQDLTWKSDKSCAVWGDFTGDGYLDLAVTGQTPSGRYNVIYYYEHDPNDPMRARIIDVNGVINESSDGQAVGDYDLDGDLDIAIAGMSDVGRQARIYENNGTGDFSTDAAQSLTAVSQASVGWGDVDNDGDLDLVIQGHDGSQAVATLYKNDPPGTLTADAGTVLTGLYSGSVDWVDWDGDGDVDLMATGSDGTNRRTIFYRNDPVGTLTPDGDHGLPGVALSDAAWGDYDNDGDLDLAFTGEDQGTQAHSRIYSNDGSGILSPVADLYAGYRSSCAWGDYDNDGDLDVAICGYDNNVVVIYTRIYENTGSGFNNSGFILTHLRNGSLTWADVEQDGDLDFLITGADFSTSYARLYKNADGVANTAPSSPEVLSSHWTETGKLRLSWSGATDDQTAAAGLYYCLRVGTAEGLDDVVSSCYGTPLMGNVGQATEIDLDVPNGDYYWSVRAIDSGFMSSEWSSAAASGDGGIAQMAIHPIDDAFVVDSEPNTPFGSTSPLNLHVGSYYYDVEDIARTYLKFPLSGFEAEDLISAELVLYCLSLGAEPYYVDVWLASHDNWDEETITWNNAPGLTAPQADGRKKVNDELHTRWDVTEYVRTQASIDGMITEVLCGGDPPEGTLDYYAEFWSEEAPVDGYHRPHLLVVYRTPATSTPDGPENAVSGLRLLSPAMPNPFTGSTRIDFMLPRESHMKMQVFDVSGRVVRRLLASPGEAGHHTVIWDGRDDGGRLAASGTYVIKLDAGGTTQSQKIVLMK